MTGERSDKEHFAIQGNYFSGPTAIQGRGLQINLSGDMWTLPAVDPDRWLDVDSLSAIELGVHRAAPDSHGDVVTRYVQRDVDKVIDEVLEEASEGGGFLLLVGNSAVGKTRTAFEAVKRNLRGFHLFSASSSGDIALFAQVAQSVEEPRVVLWLDDLERFFGEGGFSASVLGELIRSRTVVVATLRHDEYKRYRKKIGRRQREALDAAENSATYNGARVLDLVDPIEIDREWSADERERAEREDDPRLAKALTSVAEAAVCEYLAAGPQLWRIYNSALRDGKKHVGPLLVRAAIDLKRAGIKGTIPQDLLVQVALGYKDARRQPSISETLLVKGFSWGSKIRFGVTGLMEKSEEGWLPFDYLVDAAARDRKHNTIPLEVWQVALEFARDDDLFSVGWMLYLNEEYELSSQAMRKLADMGVPLAMSNLGVVLQELGQSREAEFWFGRAASLNHPAGQFNLGTVAYERDDYDRAESLWREAANSGEILAVQALATLYAKRERYDDAEGWWKKGAETGDPVSAYRLGLHLHERGRSVEAEIWWRQAAQAGHALSCLHLGNALALRGKETKASEWWNRAVELGLKSASGLEITKLTEPVTGIWQIATNAEIREKLGAHTLNSVCASLWPKDCQTCGQDLGELPPSLAVSDCLIFGFAELHHLQCRTPEWRNNPNTNKSLNLSWASRVFMLPVGASDDETGTPCFLVNPSFELVYLAPNGVSGWEAAPLNLFEKNGFGYFGPEFILDEPVSSGHRSLFDPYCVIRGSEIEVYESPAHTWSAPLEVEVLEAVRAKGGVLVAIAAYIRPDLDMSYAGLLQAMMQREVAVGWVPLSQDESPLPRRRRRIVQARFGAFQAGGEAIVGEIIGCASPSLDPERAKAWALDEIDIESDRLLPWNVASADAFFCTIDAMSVRQYALYLRADAWIVSELLVRHGGVNCGNSDELASWANAIIDVHLKGGPLEWGRVNVDKEDVLAIESVLPEDS
ncbi:tetratricopeptide repeat protein [Streptomyces sp. NPDC056817]|uniref:tetratricopeptide repeat protein n=1 Tax=Streptomyces sp. NPDC056817 TaxID=3345950 RepID=UPI0036C94F7E